MSKKLLAQKIFWKVLPLAFVYALIVGIMEIRSDNLLGGWSIVGIYATWMIVHALTRPWVTRWRLHLCYLPMAIATSLMAIVQLCTTAPGGLVFMAAIAWICFFSNYNKRWAVD